MLCYSSRRRHKVTCVPHLGFTGTHEPPARVTRRLEGLLRRGRFHIHCDGVASIQLYPLLLYRDLASVRRRAAAMPMALAAVAGARGRRRSEALAPCFVTGEWRKQHVYT